MKLINIMFFLLLIITSMSRFITNDQSSNNQNYDLIDDAIIYPTTTTSIEPYNYSKWQRSNVLNNLETKNIAIENKNNSTVVEKKVTRKKRSTNYSTQNYLIQSPNWHKELKVYYSLDKNYKEIVTDWINGDTKKATIITFSLNHMNPYNYKYFKFIGSYEALTSTRVSWWTDAYYSKYNLFSLQENKNLETQEFLKNQQIQNREDIEIEPTFILQPLEPLYENGYKWLVCGQGLTLTHFQKNKLHYLQIIIQQQCSAQGVWTSGSLFLNLGSGIRFYN